MWWQAMIFFFKQKTAYEMRISDWSSDVCSSDLSAVIDLCYLSWTSFALGAPQTALTQCRRSLEVAEASGATYDLVVAHGNACYLYQLRHDRVAVARCAQAVIDLATEKGFPHWRSLGIMFQGWVTAAEIGRAPG